MHIGNVVLDGELETKGSHPGLDGAQPGLRLVLAGGFNTKASLGIFAARLKSFAARIGAAAGAVRRALTHSKQILCRTASSHVG